MTKLSDRIEGAGEGSRELDAEIGLAHDGFYLAEPRYPGAERMYGYIDADGSRVEPGNGAQDRLIPAYTTSVDAALTLLPDGLEWELTACDPARDPRFGRFQSRIMLLTYAEDPDELGPQAIANAATPALALAAACIRAREGG